MPLTFAGYRATPELALELGSVTVWLMRGATALAFAARRRRQSLRYISTFGAWFAFAGGALLLVAAPAMARR